MVLGAEAVIAGPQVETQDLLETILLPHLPKEMQAEMVKFRGAMPPAVGEEEQEDPAEMDNKNLVRL